MSRADELGVILEARWDGFTTMCIALYKFDNFFLLFPCAPGLELVQIGEDKGIPIVGLSGAVCGFRGRGDVPCGRRGPRSTVDVLRV